MSKLSKAQLETELNALKVDLNDIMQGTPYMETRAVRRRTYAVAALPVLMEGIMSDHDCTPGSVLFCRRESAKCDWLMADEMLKAEGGL